jgi:uncharacterized membrane protein (DUF373 family)
MSDEDSPSATDSPPEQSDGGPDRPFYETYTDTVNQFIRAVELAAATVFALLFAIGVFDLTLQIFGAVRNGTITDPLVVVGFIDTGLLLLIIVEVYQTVLAYIEESDPRRIVQLVIYTGVIAMVRKIIIFRTGEYATVQDALVASGAYAIVVFALVGLLVAERVYGGQFSFGSE